MKRQHSVLCLSVLISFSVWMQWNHHEHHINHFGKAKKNEIQSDKYVGYGRVYEIIVLPIIQQHNYTQTQNAHQKDQKKSIIKIQTHAHRLVLGSKSNRIGYVIWFTCNSSVFSLSPFDCITQLFYNLHWNHTKCLFDMPVFFIDKITNAEYEYKIEINHRIVYGSIP